MLVLTRPINVLYGECFNDSVAINDFHWFNDFFHNLLMITWYTAAVYQIWYPAAVYQISGRIWDILVCCTIPISLNEPYKKGYFGLFFSHLYMKMCYLGVLMVWFLWSKDIQKSLKFWQVPQMPLGGIQKGARQVSKIARGGIQKCARRTPGGIRQCTELFLTKILKVFTSRRKLQELIIHLGYACVCASSLSIIHIQIV